MFTQYMTDEELEREAYLDFLEMKISLQIAFEDFCRQYKSSGKGRHYVHTLVSSKTYRTKRRNTWQIQFNNRCHTINNRMYRGFLVFIPIYRNDGQADYIFFRSLTDFYPEKVTVHFIQRYKERYLEPNNINLRGMPPAVYFEYSTGDMKKTMFYPDRWTEEDKKSKKIWLSDQGLFVTEKKNKLRIFITFLDQENLSRYKAMIYEEENLMRTVMKATKQTDPYEQFSILTYIIHHYPNYKTLMERYLRRVFCDRPDIDEFVAEYILGWERVENELNSLKDTERIYQKDMCQKLMSNSYIDKDLLEKPDAYI